MLHLSRELNERSSLDFRRALPFPVRRLKYDNGTEFPLAFSLFVQEANIRHRYIKPRCPQQNGKVERSHRVDNEEFWTRHTFTAFDTAAQALLRWERTYNFDRFSLALHGDTPVEKLTRLLPAANVA